MATRREFLQTIGAAAATGCAGRQTAERPPNVIVFMTDDQGYGDLRCHGNDKIETPNWDQLYGESTRLTDFHVDPTCSPTRSALMTGLYSHRVGVWHTIMSRNYLHRNETTMAEVFKNSGYRTGLFGKWHLGGNYPYRPIDRGFDSWVGYGDGGLGTSSDYWGNDRMGDHLYRDGEWEKFDGFCTDIFFDEAMRFIAESRDEPFFVYLPTNIPHNPWNVPAEWMKPYTELGLDERTARCYASITRTDWNLGRLRESLARNKLADDTLLVYLTDNGATVGAKVFNAGMRGQKGRLYDGGHRVPCFFHWPGGGLSEGRDIGRLTAHVDLLPTLIETCDLTPPRELAGAGRSLAPLLDGSMTENEWPDRTMLVETIRIPHAEKWRATIMTDRWRLVRGNELYDIKADPGQEREVSAEHPEVVEELTAFYDQAYPGLCRYDDEFARPILGSKTQPEVWLGAIDWFPEEGTAVPWAQGHVRDGMEKVGFWPVEVETAGTYEFELRRWPREAALGITAAAPPLRDPRIAMDADGIYAYPEGKALDIREAKLQVGGQTVNQTVTASDKAIPFRLDLEPGDTRVETWFTNSSGLSLSAYHVYVRKVAAQEI